MRYMHDPIGSAFELDATRSNFIVHQKFHQKFSSLCICVRVWHFKEEDLLRNSRSIGLFATFYKHFTNELLLICLPISNLKYCFKAKTNKQPQLYEATETIQSISPFKFIDQRLQIECGSKEMFQWFSGISDVVSNNLIFNVVLC